jgi:hypothetical protein
MADVKFTPGPWRLDDRGDELCIVGMNMPNHRRFGVDGEWELSKVGDDCMWDRPENEARDRANANLIAASPDLYDQLTFAVKLLDNLPGFRGTAQLDRMHAALAKARGE